MRSVLFVRHAKSSWDNASVSDFDRSLNERGKKDAREMAKYLLNRKVPLDSFISSPAKRAKKTAVFFSEVYGFHESALLLRPELYLPETESFYEVLEKVPDTLMHLAVFSHNPGITDFVNLLTDEIRVDSVPTTGVFAIRTDIQSWKDFRHAKKKFWFFDYPKNHV